MLQNNLENEKKKYINKYFELNEEVNEIIRLVEKQLIKNLKTKFLVTITVIVLLILRELVFVIPFFVILYLMYFLIEIFRYYRTRKKFNKAKKMLNEVCTDIEQEIISFKTEEEIIKYDESIYKEVIKRLRMNGVNIND